MPSVRPSTFSAGTFLNPGNYVIRNPKWVVWDYGQPQRGIQALAVKIDLIDETGKVQEQWLSAGDPKAFAPDPDNSGRLIQVGNRKELAGGSNFAFFAGRLVDNGYSEEDMPEDTDVVVLLDGLYGYVDLEDAPERSNMPTSIPDPTAQSQQPTNRKSQVPIFQQLLLMPWEADGTNGHTRPVALANPQQATQAGPSAGPSRRPTGGGPATAVAAAPVATAPVQAAAPAQNGTAQAPATRGRRAAGPATAAAATGPTASDAAIDWIIGQLQAEGGPIQRDVAMSRVFSDPDLAPIIADVAATLASPDIAAASGGRVQFDGASFLLPS